MNTNDTRFDRLADDELSEEERRELLAKLDDQPDGWRRCALAFLESQCWKKTFGEMRGEQPTTAKPEAAPASRRSPWTGHFGTVAAMAASFLVALWLGTVAHRAWTGPGNVLPVGVGPEELVNAFDEPAVPFVQPDRQQQPALAQNDPSNRYRTVRLTEPSAGASFDLPAVERDKADDQWARSVPPAMPEEVKQAFQRMGHQVDQERELVSVPLNGGRQVVVPVDKVKVRYVGNKVY